MSDWSEAQVVALANVSPADVEEAKAAWRQDAPKVALAVLDAETE